MNKSTISFALVAFIFFHTNGYAQNTDTLIFAKGRYLTSLYGSIGSEKATLVNGNSTQLKSTKNTIGTQSGVFIKNNWVLGVNFALAKEEVTNSDVNVAAEELILGFWNRLYFGKKGNGALFADLTPYFTAIDRQSKVTSGGVITENESLHGTGFGIEPALGFTYIINKNVGFGMSTSFRLARIFATRENLLTNVSVNEMYNLNQLQFNFNFQVYLDQFFF